MISYMYGVPFYTRRVKRPMPSTRDGREAGDGYTINPEPWVVVAERGEYAPTPEGVSTVHTLYINGVSHSYK